MSKRLRNDLVKVQKYTLWRLKSWGHDHAFLLFKNPLASKIPFLLESRCKKPLTIAIEPTNDCNIACKSCHRYGMHRKIGYMSFDLFTKTVDEAANVGGANLQLFGAGEPLMHPQFPKMLEYAMAKGSRFKEVVFYTNGMLLNRKIADIIVELGVDNVTISLDGIGPVNERLRCGSVYRVIEKNMNYLLEARGTRPKPRLCINATLSNQTDDELKVIQQTWKDRLNEVRFSGMVDDSFKILDLSRARKWNPNYLRENEHVCSQPFTFMAIGWNGDVTFCCQDVAGKGVIGNSAKSDLMSVWKCKELNKVRLALLTGKVEGTILCRDCKMFNFRKFKLNA